MKNNDSFITDTKFLADEYFPRGLARSGEFSRSQVRMLESFGDAYQQLHAGKRSPINEEEQDFVLVCKGKKPAQTEHERVWMQFRKKVDNRIKVSSFAYKPGKDAYDYADEEW